MVRRPLFFYGWIIVGITVISLMLIYGIRHSFSVFFPVILAEFGWSRGDTAFMLSLNLLVYGFFAPIAGSLGDRWKPYRIMLFGIVILGLATSGCAYATELWHFYLFVGIVMPIGTALCGWPLLAPALANWFAKRRGLATGLGQVGSGISFTYGIYTEFAISHLGWRNAYLVLAGTLVTILTPLYLCFFCYRPENRGLEAYGTDELLPHEASIPPTSPPKDITASDWTLGQAMNTHQLWLLVLSFFLFWGIGSYLVLAHQIKFAEDMGYSSVFAASIFAIFGVLQVAGQFSAGISDHIGREITITLANILTVGALVALVSVKDTSQPGLLYLYAVCFGYGSGLFTPTMTAAAADIFHGKNFGAIAGLLLTGMGMGGAIGPWLGGYIYDLSGSYTVAFVLCMISHVLACVAFWIAAPRNPVKIQS